MASPSGNDANSAAPISFVDSQGHQELSNGTTLTTSTGGVPAPTGRFMQDVAAQLPPSQQSPTFEEEDNDAIMHKQSAEVNPETKRVKDDDLSAVLGKDETRWLQNNPESV